MDTVNADCDVENADWTKTTWDLPPYRSAAFFAAAGTDLDSFRRTPAYAAAVDSELIHDDEWVGDSEGGDLD